MPFKVQVTCFFDLCLNNEGQWVLVMRKLEQDIVNVTHSKKKKAKKNVLTGDVIRTRLDQARAQK